MFDFPFFGTPKVNFRWNWVTFSFFPSGSPRFIPKGNLYWLGTLGEFPFTFKGLAPVFYRMGYLGVSPGGPSLSVYFGGNPYWVQLVWHVLPVHLFCGFWGPLMPLISVNLGPLLWGHSPGFQNPVFFPFFVPISWFYPGLKEPFLFFWGAFLGPRV